jgi:uncharacterized small protein (DUF1192 family)
MMEDEEKLSNRQEIGALPKHDLAPLSVGALRDYIASLQAEIARAEAVIRQKDFARGHADSFFRPASK